MIATVLEFGEFTLDRGRFELCRNGRGIALERKPMELLILLVEADGQLVTRSEIAERLWEREVFVDTEHGINTAIRKIRQVLRDDSDEPRFIQTVTGKGYRFIAPIHGLEGEPLAAGNGHTASPAQPTFIPLPPSPRKPTAEARRSRFALWLAIPATILAAVGILYGARYLLPRHRLAAANIRSLAVLPLDNLSGDPSQDYLADGMTDELTTMLAKDSTLRIVSRTSVLEYKRAHRPLPEIARALNVDGIVEGSVSRAGNRVHMTLQLIRADTDSHIWADSYDRDLNDTALPDEAAQAIARRLRSIAPVATAAPYVNPAAHDAWLRGRYLWFRDQNDQAGIEFRRAIALQPDYAPGWAGLSIYYGAAAVDDLLDPRTALPAEQQAADKSIQLDPTLPEAHLALAAAYYFNRWDFASADREALRCIDLDPRFAEPWHLRAKLLGTLNRQQEAIDTEKHAMELDPFERPWALMLAYYEARQYDAAIDDARMREQTDTGDKSFWGILWLIWRDKGNTAQATGALAKYFMADALPAQADHVRHLYASAGYGAVVRWQVQETEQWGESHYASPIFLASLHAQLGHREPALSLLEEGYRQHAPGLLWIQNDRSYDFLHSDPRYRALIQKIGLPPAY